MDGVSSFRYPDRGVLEYIPRRRRYTVVSILPLGGSSRFEVKETETTQERHAGVDPWGGLGTAAPAKGRLGHPQQLRSLQTHNQVDTQSDLGRHIHVSFLASERAERG